MSGVWWVSFADEDGCLGVVVTPVEDAEDIVALSRRLWITGLNPGGEMLANHTTSEGWRDAGEEWALEPENQNRLLSVDELRSKGYVPYNKVNPKGFDREGFEADMDAHTIENEAP